MLKCFFFAADTGLPSRQRLFSRVGFVIRDDGCDMADSVLGVGMLLDDVRQLADFRSMTDKALRQQAAILLKSSTRPTTASNAVKIMRSKASLTHII